ncbi:hypothetical protein [Nocardia wallacei]|uniref:hypothetical protein n=1 Tax=Nocardia wallacei TaxID=480035 RepID=UPI002453A420|nr:hypothetical protein [Nocardia wallacei]
MPDVPAHCEVTVTLTHPGANDHAMYFYRSAKWLSGISVTSRVVPGYWEERGHDMDGWLDDKH